MKDSIERYRVKLVFVEDVLGTVPKDREIYETFVGRKAATLEGLDEELETVETIEEKGWTGFHQQDGRPFLYDYVVKGFLKDACGMLRRARGTESAKVRAYKKIIDGLVFVEPRRILLRIPDGETVSALERPLRAQTAQGERVTLARSDTCPAGTAVEFTLMVLGGVSQALLEEWLGYGRLRGLGQWRNAGYGRFEYEMERV